MSMTTATRDEVAKWSLVVVSNRSGQDFNSMIRWLASQRLWAGRDVIFSPGPSNLATRDVIDEFRFREASKAVLFKLTFGGT